MSMRKRRQQRLPYCRHAVLGAVVAWWTAIPVLAQPIVLQPVTDVSIQPRGFTFHHVHVDGRLPSLAYADNRIMHSESAKFRWPRGTACTGLDAQIRLPVAGEFGGQSIYRLSDAIGVLVWVGDVHLSMTPMRGTARQSVFDRYCQGNTRGYRIAFQPVLLQRQAVPRYVEALPPDDVRVGTIWLRRESGDAIQGRSEFNVSLGTFAIDTRSASCRLQLPGVVALATIGRGALAGVGTEVAAGDFQMLVDCGNAVNVFASVVDLLAPDNRGQRLSVARGQARAAGVALKIYKADGQPLIYGPATALQPGNRLPSSSQPSRFAVKYVNTAGDVRGGRVEAMMAITLAFQ